jgi:thiol-disulfide isomerase/thioredoxin
LYYLCASLSLFMKKSSAILIIVLFVINVRAQTTLDTAINFNLKDIHFNKHKLFNLLDSGRFVLIDFFSPTCGACATYAPDIQQIYSQYQSNTANLYVLGIAWGGTNTVVSEWDSAYGVTFPTISGLDGNGNSVCTTYQIASYPTAILIAPNHLIANQYIYPPEVSILDSVISHAIATMSSPGAETGKLKLGIRSVFPNPVNDQLVLDVYLHESTELGLTLMDCLGSKVYYLIPELYPAGDNRLAVSLRGLPSGMYFAVVSMGKKMISVKKFIKY